ncbi:hypothetical protein G3I19_29365 [Streptomyces sp. SID10853]|uniref:hypothetical protein n=1 Tax=Streptomyces sp. SID10853 TaxID=2706028 RepID=UPI0013C15905|nr:hypothetical protein [Streptomyces sp. SID10853]NDZ82571.1 hypothetical protein [Streptomyces sp. SID10853]
MGGFSEAARERIGAARSRLAAASEAEDAYEAAMAEDELDDALRLARKHRVSTEPENGVSGQ